jgi:RHS repeat-associated protein
VPVNGAAATVKPDNAFEGKASVVAGNNTVTAVATDVNSNATTKQYNVSVTGSGTKSLVYDLNGNLSGDGTKTYEWDPLNRLTAVNNGTTRSEFTYNGLNQRVKIVEKDNGTVTNTKNLVWVGSEICEQRNETNTVKRRYYPQGMQVGPTNYWYTRDHLGSIRELTDSTGAVVTRYDYGPYGRRTRLFGTVEADFGFTGHYHHKPSGLALAQYRAYSGDFGRWISRDPIGEGGGINLYGYVQSNPISYVDPSGLKFVIDPAADRDWRSKTAQDLKKVERDLKKNAQLNPNDPCAQKYYQDFMRLKNDPNYEVFISPNTGINYYDPNDQSINFDAWNPYTPSTDADGSHLRDASVGLGHEIGHAIYWYNGGTNPWGPASNPALFPNAGEEGAVSFENAIRNGRWPNDPGRQRPKY